MSERLKAPRYVQLARWAFFGGSRCIITRSRDPSLINWHHLDDNPRNSVDFTNFLPIGPAYNQGAKGMLGYQKRTHERKSSYISEARRETASSSYSALTHPDLLREKLLAKAKEHYESWLPALAYGAARLAYYRAVLYEAPSEVVLLETAAKALFYARNRLTPVIPEGDRAELKKHYKQPLGYYVIRAILQKDLLVPLRRLTGDLPKETAFELLRTISGLLSEHGHRVEAAWAYDMVARHRLTPEKDRNPADYGAYVRREAISRLTRGPDPVSTREIANVTSMLREVREIRGDSFLNLQIGTALYQGWIACLNKKYDTAYDHIAPFVIALEDSLREMEVDPSAEPVCFLKTVTPWNIIEIMQLYVAIACFRRAATRNDIERACQIAQRIQTATGYHLAAELPVSVHESILALHPIPEIYRIAASVKRNLPHPILRGLLDSLQLIERKLNHQSECRS